MQFFTLGLYKKKSVEPEFICTEAKIANPLLINPLNTHISPHILYPAVQESLQQ